MASGDDMQIFIAECLGATAHPAVKVEVSKVVAQYGSEGFLSLLNGERTVTAATKVVISKLALMFAVAHRGLATIPPRSRPSTRTSPSPTSR